MGAHWVHFARHRAPWWLHCYRVMRRNKRWPSIGLAFLFVCIIMGYTGFILLFWTLGR